MVLHIFISWITILISSFSKPVSYFTMSVYMSAGFPGFLTPCFGNQCSNQDFGSISPTEQYCWKHSIKCLDCIPCFFVFVILLTYIFCLNSSWCVRLLSNFRHSVLSLAAFSAAFQELLPVGFSLLQQSFSVLILAVPRLMLCLCCYSHLC